MKIAIYGAGPAGLEAALKFHLLGAHVVLFDHLKLNERHKRGVYALMSTFFGDEKIATDMVTTSWGKRLSGLQSAEEISFNDYFENYYTPLLKAVAELGLIKNQEVHRIHKRFLSQKEEIAGRSRFLDLFRIVSLKTPDFTEEDIKGTLLEKLGDSIVDSLEAPYEIFEDFDIVIETPIDLKPKPMGPSDSYALNETRLGDGIVFYGADAVDYVSKLNDQVKNLVIVGSGLYAGLALKKLFAVPEEKRPKTLWVSTAENPIEDTLNQLKKFGVNTDDLYQEFSSLEDNWNASREKYQKALFEWRDLEDYMKAKIKAPELPSPKFEIKHLSNVTAIDRLLDQSKNYITIESPSFRQGSEEDLMETHVFDVALVFTGHENSKLAQGLNNSEKGFFYLDEELGPEQKIWAIEKELLTLFSPA